MLEINGEKHYIIGHRGNEYYDPENTLNAFKTAFKMGADLIETDIQMTKDNDLIVFHDKYLNKKTNFSGKVKKYTLKELKNAHYTYFKDRVDNLIALTDLFEWFNANEADKGIIIELKNKFNITGIKRLLALIDMYNLRKNVIVDSFNYKTLKQLRKTDNSIILSWLYPKTPIRKLQDKGVSLLKKIQYKLDKINCSCISLHQQNLLPNVIRFFKDRNLMVFGWGIKKPKDYQKFVNLKGLNGFTASKPDEVLKLRT